MSQTQRIILVVIAVIGATGIAAGVAIALTPGHFAPTDSGVMACQTLAKNAKDNKPGSDKAMTEADYKKTRAPFEKSSFIDIRVAGTNVVDTVYKADRENQKNGDIGHAIVLMNTLQNQWGALQVACGHHGVVVPQLPTA
jgi:hypothetical protein